MFGNVFCWQFQVTAWSVAPVGGAEHPDLAMPRWGQTGPGGFLMLCFNLWQPCFLPCSRCWSWALHFPFEVDGGRENLSLFCVCCVLFLPFPGSQIYGTGRIISCHAVLCQSLALLLVHCIIPCRFCDIWWLTYFEIFQNSTWIILFASL